MAPLIVAHRGASAGLPDNSIQAYERAIEIGADMIEFDVRRCAGDELIAFHDEDVDGVPIGELTRAEIADRTGHVPPLLSQVLELTAGRIGLDVELKERGYLDAVLPQLSGRVLERPVVVTSFLDDVVAAVKRLRPDLRTGLLIGSHNPRPYVRTRLAEINPVARVREVKADVVGPHVALARLGALRNLGRAGIPVYVWTVNDDRTLAGLMRDKRVAAIITDVPERAIALRDARARRRRV